MKKIKNNSKNFVKKEVIAVVKPVEPVQVDLEIRKCEICRKIIIRPWCQDEEVDENDFCSEKCFKRGSAWYGDWWDN